MAMAVAQGCACDSILGQDRLRSNHGCVRAGNVPHPIYADVVSGDLEGRADHLEKVFAALHVYLAAIIAEHGAQPRWFARSPLPRQPVSGGGDGCAGRDPQCYRGNARISEPCLMLPERMISTRRTSMPCPSPQWSCRDLTLGERSGCRGGTPSLASAKRFLRPDNRQFFGSACSTNWWL